MDIPTSQFAAGRLSLVGEERYDIKYANVVIVTLPMKA
jgi:hypothetical protein